LFLRTTKGAIVAIEIDRTATEVGVVDVKLATNWPVLFARGI